MKEIFVRFVIGGAVVSLFALLGGLFKPKSFAGLFGAAPSVALATLTLTVASDGRWYAAREARSMVVGAIAFFVYASLISSLTMRHKWKALPVASASVLVWLGVAFALWRLCLR
jgi:uncharacterized membrane-anchored protein